MALILDAVTSSRVGYFEDGIVKIRPNDVGNRSTPSYVAFTDNGERLVGDAAKYHAFINPANTIFDVKRLIGRDFTDETVQAVVDEEGSTKQVPYKIISINNKPMVEIIVNGNTTAVSPEEISAMIIEKMKSTAESFIGKKVENAVLAVPPYFNDDQRKAMEVAGEIAGLNVRVLSEPIAAAITYGIAELERELNVLVCDLGGRTFDVTLLTSDHGVFEILATSSDLDFGGENFDQQIMQYYIKKLKDDDKVDIGGDKRALRKLRKEVERAKMSLFSVDSPNPRL